MKKLITVLTAIIVLASCGVPEIAEATTTPATTTAATFEISTAVDTTTNTTATTTALTTTAPPETTTEATTTYPAVEIYAVEFPIEFPAEYLRIENAKPLSDEDYQTEISPEAEKLYADYLAFVDKQILDYFGYEKYLILKGCFSLLTSGQYYGLIDLNNDGKPEIFTYNTNGSVGNKQVYFYDLYGESPFTTISDFYCPGFNIEGATYFGKYDNGNIVMCSGYNHSESEGQLMITELLYKSNTTVNTLEKGEEFGAVFGRSSCFYCDAYYLNGVTYGVKADIVPAADFEAAYREFYDARDFDVYWICGDILYHGAEETEYKGKIAYEKYLEFTKKQEYLAEKSKYDDNKILIDDINNDGTDDIIYINNWSATFAYYHNGEIKEIRAEANWGGELEGGGAPLYYNKETDEFLTVSTASSYRNYSFYEFSEGEYKLKNKYIWRELIVPWDIDKWTEMPNLESFLEKDGITFEDLKKLNESELLGIAWTLGTFDRVNLYTIDEKEVTEAEWQKAIDEFIAADDTILLCPENTDLEFVDVSDVDGDLSAYVEAKLPNK
jgi:hypothetical protein